MRSAAGLTVTLVSFGTTVTLLDGRWPCWRAGLRGDNSYKNRWWRRWGVAPGMRLPSDLTMDAPQRRGSMSMRRIWGKFVAPSRNGSEVVARSVSRGADRALPGSR